MYAELINKLPNEDACLRLIDLFDGTLRKYSHFLKYDDAYNDMILFFIELIYKLHGMTWVNENADGKIVNYICKALKNEYIRLSKMRISNSELAFSDLERDNISSIDNLLAKEKTTELYEYFPKGAVLSELEKETIILIFGYGYTVSEIATVYGKSRQAINQTKLRALRKLTKLIDKN